MQFISVAIGAFLLFALYEVYEKRCLSICRYTISSEKVKRPFRIGLFSDLHGYHSDASQNYLAERILKEAPDLVLIPGDLISRQYPGTQTYALLLMQKLSEKVPVYASLGNHEQANLKKEDIDPDVRSYFAKLEALHVQTLDNESVRATINGQTVCISGYTPDISCYDRTGASIPDIHDLNRKLGSADENVFQILLAHTPAGHNAYEAWAADLTVSGHYHGGVFRIGNRGLITPQLHFFTKHAHGAFRKDDSTLIVTSGLGVHAIPFRICNRPEIVIIEIKPRQES